MMRSRPSRVRRGFTLIEMLVIMWAYGVLMVLGGVLVSGTLSARQAATTTQDRIARYTTLADRFRGDVAVATSLPDTFETRPPGPPGLALAVEGGQIVYSADGHRVTRSETVGGQTVNTDFPLGKYGSAEFVRPSGPSDLVRMRLTERPPDGPVRSTEIGAALGGDLR